MSVDRIAWIGSHAEPPPCAWAIAMMIARFAPQVLRASQHRHRGLAVLPDLKKRLLC